MNWQRFFLLFGLAILLAVPLPASSVAAQAGGVSFLDSGPLIAQLPAGANQVVLEVQVFNGSLAPQTITLDLVRMADQAGASLPDGVLNDLPMVAKTVDPAQVHTFKLVFQRLAGLTGDYSGELAAYGSDGSLARLSLEFKVAAPPAPTPDGLGVEPAYLGELTLAATNRLPSPLAALLGASLEPPSFQVAQAYSSTQRIVGQLAGEQGTLARVRQQGTDAFVEGLSRAGEYQGKLDFLPGQEGGELALTVKVRDAWYYALALLLIGLAAAGWLDYQVKVRRPRVQLSLRLAQIKDKAISAQSQAVQDLSQGWKARFGNEVLRIYLSEDEQAEQPQSMLGREARRILDNFDQADSDTERQKWGALGDPVARLESSVDTLRSLHKLNLKIFASLEALQALDIPHFEKLPVVIQALEACRPALIGDANELERKTEAIESAATFLEKYHAQYLKALELKDKFHTEPEQDEVNEILQELQSPNLTSIDYLERLESRLQRLDLMPAIPGMTKAGLNAQQAVGTFTKGPQPLIDLPELLERLIRPRRALPVDTVAIRKLLRSLDRRYAIAAGAIALTTGFAATYLSNPTYGSLADYLNTFLWSTTVSAGIQIARHFLPLR